MSEEYYDFDKCPMCKRKGNVIEDQLNRVLKCGNTDCMIEIYREVRVKPLV